MGTNYYLRATMPACAHCGRGEKVHSLHIGKASAGWNFSLRIYPLDDDGNSNEVLEPWGVSKIVELDDWRPLLKKFPIFDEYNGQILPASLLETITEREPGLKTHEEPGCSRRGAGTYDLCWYDFS